MKERREIAREHELERQEMLRKGLTPETEKAVIDTVGRMRQCLIDCPDPKLVPIYQEFIRIWGFLEKK